MSGSKPRVGIPIPARSPRQSEDELSVSDLVNIERGGTDREFHVGLRRPLAAPGPAGEESAAPMEQGEAPLESSAALVQQGAASAEPSAAPMEQGAAPVQQIAAPTERGGATEADSLPGGLCTAALERPGLERALDLLLMRLCRSTPVSTTLIFDDWAPLSNRETARHVFRIVREAVKIVLEHSGGTHIVLSLTRSGGRCEVCVGGDGTALSAKSTLVGVGLREMRDRARLIRGSLRLQRRRTRTVRLSFPV